MKDALRHDIDRFFEIYQSRTAGLLDPLPLPVKQKIEEELGLLRVSLQNRVAEDLHKE